MNRKKARQTAKTILNLLEARFQPPYGELEIREIIKILTSTEPPTEGSTPA